MWLLDTATAELHFFNSLGDVPRPGYTILSHVWGKHEQTFQEVKAVGEACKLSGENPRDVVSEKIRRCCEIAEGEGYKWVWIDTCCIDKTSSAELSEAINSMFRYYALSAACFVYLSDVEQVSHLGSKFGDHRCCWTTRGWTLQELIAPTVVILLSRSWIPIGSKHSLADNLEEVTGIPASLLRHETRLFDYSVAQRMSWAAWRQTTRMEDEAYCLLGIFDINMPTLYGEGRRAFQRLQEELMKTTLDTTLFAWGGGRWSPINVKDMPWTPPNCRHVRFPLLARAPSDFKYCSNVVYSPRSNGPEDSMTFTITPHGILARVPLVVYEEKTFVDLSCTLLHEPMFLRVYQSTKGGVYSVIGPRIGSRIFTRKSDQPVPCGEMTKIYLANGAYGSDSPPTECPIVFPCNGSPHAPFHFSFTLDGTPRYTDTNLDVVAQNVEEGWKGSPPAIIQILHGLPEDAPFLVICGICTAQTPQVGSIVAAPLSHIHWARVLWTGYRSEGRRWHFDTHDCEKDHIAGWQDLKRCFRGDCSGTEGSAEAWEVRLSFVESKMFHNTLVLRSITWDEEHAHADPLAS